MPAQFSGTIRSLSNDTPRFAYLAWLVAGLALAAWSWWFFVGRVTVYEVSTRALLEVQQAPHPVAAPVSGTVIAVSVVTGQEVRAGDVLATLDAIEDELRLREEQSRLAALSPRIDSLHKEIAALEQARLEDQHAAQSAVQAAKFRTADARAALEFANENARRMKEEGAAGSVAQIDAMRAMTEARKLAASSDALAADARRLEQDGVTRAHQGTAQIESLKRAAAGLEGEMATSQASILRLRAAIEKHLVRTPIAGRIGDAVTLRAGGYVTAGQKLATVVPRGDLLIVADFNPASVLGRVRPGQNARLRLDGFPWAEYGSIEARVSRVATEISDNLVRVEFVPASQQAAGMIMQHGLPGTIEVSIDQASPAVLLLRSTGQLLHGAQPAVREGRL